MAAIWAKIVAFFTSIIMWISSLFGIGGGTKPPEPVDPFDLLTSFSEFMELPEFSAGEKIGFFICSGTTKVAKFSGTTSSDFESYKEELVQDGFSVYDENTIESNLFATLVNDSSTVTLSHFKTGVTQIIVEDRGDLCPLSDPCEEVCDSLITGFKGSTVVAAEGMGFVIRLADGSFCIIDGGMGDPDHVDSTNLMNVLLAQKPASHEKPVIAAWIFTHLHGDHIGVFNCFSLDHHDDVELQRLIFNFPTENQTAASDSPYMLDDTIYRYTQFKKNLNDFYPDVPVLKVHGGNRFKVRNADFEVLYAIEDLLPKTILDGGMNEDSLLLKMTLEGQTVLWTGDFAFNATNLVLSEYDSALSADILQMAHHGMNGTVSLYSKVDPTFAFLPVWAGGIDTMLSSKYPQNQWLVNSPKLKQMIVTCCGTWTIKMPYSPVEGTYERIPTESTVYPSYPTLLGS